jgi:hypothetical protein
MRFGCWDTELIPSEVSAKKEKKPWRFNEREHQRKKTNNWSYYIGRPLKEDKKSKAKTKTKKKISLAFNSQVYLSTAQHEAV